METHWSRRKFLEFLGHSSTGLMATSFLPATLLASCSAMKNRLPTLTPSQEDDLVLLEGFQYSILLEEGTILKDGAEFFGTENDFLTYFPLSSKNRNDGILWSNHESFRPILLHKMKQSANRTIEQVRLEQKNVGGSLVRIKKNHSKQKWEYLPNSIYNRRLDAQTPIPFAWHEPIFGSKAAIGTLANCAGGTTPWETVLSCEENYFLYYGEIDYSSGKRVIDHSNNILNWSQYFNYPPEHYGWVVEINPKTGHAKKLVALGRFSHEGATSTLGKDGRAAVYMGDDAEGQCVYKFIADQKGSVETGTLYVANLEKGQWISLDRNSNEKLKNRFSSQTDLLIRTREAAQLVGGTPLGRPEDIEINPINQEVLISLTSTKVNGKKMGSLLKISEKNKDPLSLEFQSSTFLSGGDRFANPDNLIFDHSGNLWMCSDISGSKLNQGDYTRFGNNGLFFTPMHGAQAGEVFQVASAPNEAEFTGPCFSPDGKTLFLSVQHPGDESKTIHALTSHWPKGGTEIPRSAVIALSGPLLEKCVNYRG